MSAYITSAAQSFSKMPISGISDSLISGASNALNNINPSGSIEKIFTHVPIRAFGFAGTQLALLGLSFKLYHTAYKCESTKSKLFYGTAAIAASVVVGFELLRFTDVVTCFSTYDCFSANMLVCTEKAQELYLSCISA